MDEKPIDDVLAAMEKPLHTAGTDAKSNRNDAALQSTVATLMTLVSVVGRQQRQITELRGRVDALEAQLGDESHQNG